MELVVQWKRSIYPYVEKKRDFVSEGQINEGRRVDK